MLLDLFSLPSIHKRKKKKIKYKPLETSALGPASGQNTRNLRDKSPRTTPMGKTQHRVGFGWTLFWRAHADFQWLLPRFIYILITFLCRCIFECWELHFRSAPWRAHKKEPCSPRAHPILGLGTVNFYRCLDVYVFLGSLSFLALIFLNHYTCAVTNSADDGLRTSDELIRRHIAPNHTSRTPLDLCQQTSSQRNRLEGVVLYRWSVATDRRA